MKVEALYYEKSGDCLKCLLCPVRCVIPKGKAGFCRVRVNEDGILHSKYYGKVASVGLDPIEKKPLYNFKPKSLVLSVGGYSCNMRCPYCQNHSISMSKPELEEFSPQTLARAAKNLEPRGNIGLAYTYNEPLINYEFVMDCAREAKKLGLVNVAVTNGYINEAPLLELLPLFDAMNIDLKGFSEKFYHGLKGSLADVTRTIKYAAESCHVELPPLVIPGENDSEEEMDAEARWIASVSPEIPLHLSRYFPNYKYSAEATPADTLRRLKKTAEKHLKYVYLGNML